jgi:hypothetical protein
LGKYCGIAEAPIFFHFILPKILSVFSLNLNGISLEANLDTKAQE